MSMQPLSASASASAPCRNTIAEQAAAFASGENCRIGGLALTQRALGLCGFTPPALLADIGCGQGATVRYLRCAGFEAYGLDCQPIAVAQAGEHCHVGDATALPYTTGSMDGLLFECSLSQMAEKKQSLAEAQRVLQAGGRLIISDLYARNQAVTEATLPTRAHWQSLLEQAGFSIIMFEDISEQLKALTAQLLWQQGPQAWDALCGHNYSIDTLRVARCGYFLLLAQKQLPHI